MGIYRPPPLPLQLCSSLFSHHFCFFLFISHILQGSAGQSSLGFHKREREMRRDSFPCAHRLFKKFRFPKEINHALLLRPRFTPFSADQSPGATRLFGSTAVLMEQVFFAFFLFHLFSQHIYYPYTLRGSTCPICFLVFSLSCFLVFSFSRLLGPEPFSHS